MAASSFEGALARVLRHEGGFSDHPADPGGPTDRGVTQRIYDAYRGARGVPNRDVREMTQAELTDIYRRNYWDAVRADDLPAGIDYAVFDAAVNSGPAQAAKWLQRALGVAADGSVGALTLAAAAAAPQPERVVQALCDLRLAMLKGLRTWPVFGRGWGRRVADVRRDAVLLARGAAPVPVEQAGAGPASGGKGRADDLAIRRIAASPEALAAAMAAVASLANAAAAPGPLQWALALAVLGAVGFAALVFVRRRRAA